MKKIKEIEIDLNLKGNGIVNYDSGDQKYIWGRERVKTGITGADGVEKTERHRLADSHNNIMYAKKTYYRDSKGNLQYKIKISSNSLRNAIFKNDNTVVNSSIMHNPVLFNSYITSIPGIVRGYMFAKKTATFRKKSALTITDAIQTNNAESNMEFFSKSGQKIEKEKGESAKEEKSDTSIFKKETIGDITYNAKGYIDVENIQFISADNVADRKAFDSDEYINYFEKFIKTTLNNYNSELAYHQLKNAEVFFPEYGIKLNNENTVFIIKETLKRLLNTNIKRNNAFATVSSLKINLKSNINDNNWIEIKTLNDIDNLEFDVYDYYTTVDSEDAIKMKKEIEEKAKLERQKDKKTKKTKKTSKTTENETTNNLETK